MSLLLLNRCTLDSYVAFYPERRCGNVSFFSEAISAARGLSALNLREQIYLPVGLLLHPWLLQFEKHRRRSCIWMEFYISLETEGLQFTCFYITQPACRITVVLQVPISLFTSEELIFLIMQIKFTPVLYQDESRGCSVADLMNLCTLQ